MMCEHLFNLNNNVSDLLQLEIGLKSFQTINWSNISSKSLFLTKARQIRQLIVVLISNAHCKTPDLNDHLLNKCL
jgi:hypothetical protein